MYRIVGCILVVAAGAGMGFSGSMRLSEQIRILEKLLQMVICLKGEIRCGNASLPDAFYGAAGRMNGKYREFLISAADRMKAGTGEKLSQICRECAESALPRSSILRTIPVAFIFLNSSCIFCSLYVNVMSTICFSYGYYAKNWEKYA